MLVHAPQAMLRNRKYTQNPSSWQSTVLFFSHHCVFSSLEDMASPFLPLFFPFCAHPQQPNSFSDSGHPPVTFVTSSSSRQTPISGVAPRGCLFLIPCFLSRNSSFWPVFLRVRQQCPFTYFHILCQCLITIFIFSEISFSVFFQRS